MEAGPERSPAGAPEAIASPPGKYCLAPPRAGGRVQSRPCPGGPSPACKAARPETCSARSARPAPPTPAGRHAAPSRQCPETPHAFLLESVERGEQIGRYTFLGARPYMRVRASGGKVEVERNGRTEKRAGNVFQVVKETLRAHHLAAVPGLPPFTA